MTITENHPAHAGRAPWRAVGVSPHYTPHLFWHFSAVRWDNIITLADSSSWGACMRVSTVFFDLESSGKAAADDCNMNLTEAETLEWGDIRQV